MAEVLLDFLSLFQTFYRNLRVSKCSDCSQTLTAADYFLVVGAKHCDTHSSEHHNTPNQLLDLDLDLHGSQSHVCVVEKQPDGGGQTFSDWLTEP